MRYFYDCEFLEDGRTILPISIGIKASDGRSYYAVNSEIQTVSDSHDRVKRHEWLMENVIPYLPLKGGYTDKTGSFETAFTLDLHSIEVKPLWVIRNEVLAFLFGGTWDPDDKIELWGEYAAYDHVLLAQLWGRTIDLPDGIPMYTNDLIQLFRMMDLDPNEVPMEGVAHVAIDDAVHAEKMYQYAMDKKTLIDLEEGMTKWEEGHSAAVQGRRVEGSRNDLLLAILVRHLGGRLVVTQNDLRAAETATLVTTNVGNGAMEIAVFHTKGGGEIGIEQGRQEGVRLQEPAQGVSEASGEEPVEGEGGSDSQRGSDESGSVPDGEEGIADS